MPDTRIHISACTNPWINLAIDHVLHLHPEQPQPVLFLWQNQRTVVLGRNQNAWKECRTTLLEQEGGRLARRPSGGGAVFHDLGNLCFTFACAQADYDLARHWEIIRQALLLLDIPCETSGRNDLTVEGRKFSGSAFAFQQQRALHHGTLMVDVDMQDMTRYLSVSKEKIAAKGVDSVRARVINLREIQPTLSIEQLQQALIAAFAQSYNLPPQALQSQVWTESALHEHAQGELAYQRYAGWEWRYGASPIGDIELETRFPWGGVQLQLTAQSGRVALVQVYSDALDVAFIDELSECLTGAELSPQGLSQAAAGVQPKVLAQDVAHWLAGCDL